MITLIAGLFDTNRSSSADDKWCAELRGEEWHEFEFAAGWLKVKLDASYRLTKDKQWIIIHDGRIDRTHAEPSSWNGSFVAFRFCCENEDGVVLVTDRLGTIPLYLGNRGKEVFFSTKLSLLLRAGFRKIDETGAWQLLLFNHPLWRRTLVKDVHLAPPGSRITIKPGSEPTIDRYWAVDSIGEATDSDIDFSVDKTIELLKSAHNKFGNPPNVTHMLPVTGGLDSRVNLAIWLYTSRQFILFHSRARGDWDTRFAERIASSLNQQFFSVSTEDGLRKIVELSSSEETGELNVAQWWLCDLARKISDTFDSPIWWDGYLQDVLFNPHIVDGDVEAAIQRQLKVAAYRLGLLGLSASRKPFDKLFELFIEEYCERRKPGRSANLEYYLENRSRRYILGTVRIAQNYMPVCMPGIDNDVMEFGLSLPWSLRKGGWIYKKAIARLSPVLASVPDSKTGLSLLSKRRKNYVKSIFDDVYTSLERIWPLRPVFKTPITSIDELLRQDEAFRRKVSSVLTASPIINELFDGFDPVPCLIEAQMTGRNAGGVLQGLLTLAKFEQGEDIDLSL